MTGRLGIVLQSALLQYDGPSKAAPEGHQEVGPRDFQPNQISLQLLTWKVAVCHTGVFHSDAFSTGPSGSVSVKIQSGPSEITGTFLPLGFEDTGREQQLLQVCFLSSDALGHRTMQKEMFLFCGLVRAASSGLSNPLAHS